MKKLVIIGVLILIVFLACTNGNGDEESTEPADTMQETAQAEPETTMEPEDNKETFDKSATAGGVTFSWRIDGDVLRGQMSSETEGWVSVGFDPSQQMADANLIIGYIEDGEVFIRDDFGIGAIRHGADVDNGGVSNVTDVSGEEVDGVTTIRFTIPLDSGDDLDGVLAAGGTHKIIFAHGPDRADNFGTYHAGRGSAEVEL